MFNKPTSGEVRGWFVDHLSQTYVAQHSVTKIITLAIVNLVTPKVGAKHELLFNKPASGEVRSLSVVRSCMISIVLNNFGASLFYRNHLEANIFDRNEKRLLIR